MQLKKEADIFLEKPLETILVEDISNEPIDTSVISSLINNAEQNKKGKAALESMRKRHNARQRQKEESKVTEPKTMVRKSSGSVLGKNKTYKCKTQLC